MSKLDNLTFYSKLQDLFDSIPPQEVPNKINEAILFVKHSVKWYESEHKKSLSEVNDGYEMLVGIKQAFEDALIKEGSWGFCLVNNKRDMQVNLKVFYNFLSDNVDFYLVISTMTETWHHLINEKNYEQYKKIQPIISALKNTFDESTYTCW